MPFATDSVTKYVIFQEKSLPLPEGRLEGRTVIVTGSNSGIGKSAAHHFAERKPARLILAVRNEKAGHEAAAEIAQATGGSIQPEVWQLDMSSFTSVRGFARKCEERLDRLDVFVANAGILPQSYKSTEDGLEVSLQVNVVATLLLSELILPILQRTANKPLPGIPVKPHLTINTSFTHTFVGELRGFENGTMIQCANEMKASDKWDGKCYERGKGPDVIVSTADPGAVATNVTRDMSAVQGFITRLYAHLFCRTPEQGARPIVWAALAPIKSGQYVADCKVTLPSALVQSDVDGSKSAGIWTEMRAIWRSSSRVD